MFKNTNSKKMTAILLALVLVTSLFLGITIARYVTSTSSEDDARVAKWGFSETPEPITMNLFKNEYKLEDGTVVAKSNDDADIIAPGLNGVSKFKFVTSSMSPEVMYEVKISVDDSEIADEIKNHPGIQWKVDNGNWVTWDEMVASLVSLSGDPSGTKVYAPGELHNNFKNTTEHTIAWQWLMDASYDVEDTAMGNLAADGTPITAKIVVTVLAQQTDIDSTGMLEGNRSVYNTNDPQPLTFRADADYSTFKDVEINDTTLNPSNYTPSEGSIKITLKKEYLKTLPLGDHKITINTKDGKSIESKFTVTNNTTIVHNGIIPEGGKYYVGIDKFYDTEIHQDYVYQVGHYDNYDTLYTTGDKFPTPQIGDVYVYGDYEYKFGYSSDPGYYWYEGVDNGWGVIVIDRTKTSYGNMLTTINGKDVKNLDFCYSFASNLAEPPTIPNKAESMFATFRACTSLTTAPIIPESVTYLNYTFAESPNLKGTIEINANLDIDDIDSYDYMLYDTQISWITGSISDELKEAIARNSNIELQYPVKNGTYFHDVSETTKYLPEYGEMYTGYFLGDYSGAKTIIEPGETLPKTPKTGDIYVYGDYEYRYNMWYMGDNYIFEGGVGADPSSSTSTDDWTEGWIVINLDRTKTSYGEILDSIAGKPVTMLPMTFYDCKNMITAPKIPETVVTLYNTFSGCTSLTTAPKIPSSVKYMFRTFADCIKLDGPIEINTSKLFAGDNYWETFVNTKIDSLNDFTGSITNIQKHSIAQGSGIILEDPSLYHNNVIPTGGTYYKGIPSSNEAGNYSGYTEKYVAGNNFPSAAFGDRYVFNNSEYIYSSDINMWSPNNNGDFYLREINNINAIYYPFP